MDEKMLSLEQETKIKEKALKLKEEKKLRKIYPMVVFGEPIVKTTLLPFFGTEDTVNFVHHCLDVVYRRGQRGFRLHQLAHSLAESYDLFGALRGVDVDGIIDLIVLFLSHD